MNTHTQAEHKSKKSSNSKAPSKLRKRIVAVAAALVAVFVILPSFAKYVLHSDALSVIDFGAWAGRGFEVELSAEKQDPAPFFMESVLRRVIKANTKARGMNTTNGFTETGENFTETGEN